MPLTLDQVRTQELAALGLPPNATANQINQRLRRVTPGTAVDNRTGLPFTHATAVDEGSNQALGQIVGGAGLGLALGEVAAGITRLFGGAAATSEAGTAAAGAGEAGSAAAGGGEAAAGAGAGGGAAAGAASNIFKVAKFAAVADFLAYIAWIFHPQTLLRVVEFIMGVLIGGWGIYILTARSARSGSGSSSHLVTRALGATPAGRVARVAQGRRMGRREGQREAARMESRQKETRSQREASAVEREQINRNARAARNN
jgi:hypothetical protein